MLESNPVAEEGSRWAKVEEVVVEEEEEEVRFGRGGSRTRSGAIPGSPCKEASGKEEDENEEEYEEEEYEEEEGGRALARTRGCSARVTLVSPPRANRISFVSWMCLRGNTISNSDGWRPV